MISTAVWSSRIQAALGREPRSIQEALEGLRKVLKGDEVAKAEFYQAVREQERFERFSRDDRVALMVWAALKEALEKTRKHLGQETASTTVIRKDERLKEEVKGVRKVGTWKSPEGRVYDVFPWDLKPGIRKGVQIKHPQYGQGTILHGLHGDGVAVYVGFSKAGRKKLALKAVKGMMSPDKYATQPDRRVADAKAELERFLSGREEVRSMSRLEREEEFGGNPHFSDGLVSQETVARLEKLGIPVDPYNLQDLAVLASTLDTKTEKFKEGILGISTVRTRDAKAVGIRKPGLGWETKVSPDGRESFAELVEGLMAHEALVEALQGEWSVGEVREHFRKLTGVLPPADAKRLSGLLQEIAALRLLKVELHRAGFAPVRAVAYRDSSGETVYTAPVYG